MKITIDKAQIKQKIDSAAEKALWATTTEIKADCNEFVKRDIGTLENSAQIKSEPQKGLITYDTPYAKRQYWEIKTSLTPGRTWRWFETAKQKYGDRWKGLYEKALKRFL